MRKFLQLVLVFTFVPILVAQGTSTQKDTSEAPRLGIHNYKVSYLIYELEDGKKINERAYSFPVTTVDGKPRDVLIKIGSRVPIAAKEGQFQYIDVGLNIQCNLAEQAEKFAVNSDIEITSLLPEQAADPRSAGNPVLRSIKQHFNTLVSPGKPTLVTSIDDPNSKKRLQVEVTATRLE